MSILITKDTTFIIQGITGREAVNMSRECLDYGSKIVGGVTPGRGGRDIYGIPVYDTVREITAQTRVDGSVVAVPPAFTRDAVFEALDAGVKIVVIVTERIPRYEVAQMVELAQMKGARIIGPNCLGILSPGEAKMGGLGGRAVDARKAFTKGSVGVMSRSGGMTTEMCNTLTAAGPRPVDRGVDRRRRGDRLDLRRPDAALRGRCGDQGDRHLLRARRPHGSGARELRGREEVAPADRRLHGRPLHGRDAGHALRARRHHRRGQGRYHRRQDRAPAEGAASRSPSGSRTSRGW